MRRPAILVIRAEDSFSRFLRESDFEVLTLELIKTEPVDDLSELRETIKRIGEYEGIFITSPVAGEIFARQLNGDGRRYSGIVYVLGDRTRDVLAGSELNVVHREKANTARDLIASFGDDEFDGKKLLFVRGERSMRTIPQMLKGKAIVDELIVYRTIESQPDDDWIRDIKSRFEKNEIERVCFFSPSGVESFIKTFAAEDYADVKGAAIGETTAHRAREAGIYIDFISQRATAEHFAGGLAAYIKSIE